MPANNRVAVNRDWRNRKRRCGLISWERRATGMSWPSDPRPGWLVPADAIPLDEPLSRLEPFCRLEGLELEGGLRTASS